MKFISSAIIVFTTAVICNLGVNGNENQMGLVSSDELRQSIHDRLGKSSGKKKKKPSDTSTVCEGDFVADFGGNWPVGSVLPPSGTICKSIVGSLTIKNCKTDPNKNCYLPNSLNSITEITEGSGLNIIDNDGLDSLSTVLLGKITSLSNLYINNNNLITDLSGLGALTTVVTNMQVSNNAALTSLSGTAVTSVGSWLTISNNNQLITYSDFNTLETVGVRLRLVTSNRNMQDIKIGTTGNLSQRCYIMLSGWGGNYQLGVSSTQVMNFLQANCPKNASQMDVNNGCRS